jgi:hypothetical protein
MIPACAYMGQAVFVYAAAGRWGMALAFASYTLGNIGFMLDMRGH